MECVNCDINLIKNSVKVVKGDEDNKYYIQFNYDSKHECIITVYFCITEARDAYNYPIYFMTPKTLPPPNSYKFSAGLN